jgi:hypothetical protein
MEFRAQICWLGQMPLLGGDGVVVFAGGLLVWDGVGVLDGVLEAVGEGDGVAEGLADFETCALAGGFG